MAISVVKFMQARYGDKFKDVNMYAHQNTLSGAQVQAIREGLKTYAETAAKDYNVLLKFQKDTKSKDETLISTLKNLNTLIKEMGSMDINGASTSKMNEFFKKYRTTFEGMAPLEGEEGKSEHQRMLARALQANKGKLREQQNQLADAIGEKFESVIAKNADTLVGAQGSALKIVLSSFLGPAAPLLAAVDKLFDIDSVMSNATKSTFGFLRDSFSKQQKEHEDSEKEADRRQDEQRGWFASLTDSLERKEDARKAAGKGFLGTFGLRLMEGVLKPFKLLEKLPGFKLIERVLGHLGGGLARAALGVVGGGARVLGKIPFVKTIGKGLLSLLGRVPGLGMLGGGAEVAGAAEGAEGVAAAAGGAAAAPVLAAVAAVAAAGFGVYELFQHRKEVKDFLEKTGALKAAKTALDGISKIASLVVSGVEAVGSAVENSGLIQAIQKLMGALGGLVSKGASWVGAISVEGIEGAMKYLNSLFDFLGRMWDAAEASGLPQLLGAAAKWGLTKYFGMIGGMISWVADLVDAISTGTTGDFLTKTWVKVKSGFESAMSGMAEVFGWVASNVGPFIVEPLVKILAAVQNSVGGMLTWVGTTLTSGWLGKIVSHIPGAAKMLQGLIAEGASIRGSAAGMLANNAKARAAGATNIRNTAQSAVNALTPPTAAGASGVVTGSAIAQGKSPAQAAAAGAAASGAVYSASRKVGALLVPDPTIRQVIVDAAKMVGVDPGLMLAIASSESGFNPDAKAKTSSASGLYQFTRGTWNEMVAKYGAQYGITSNMQMDPKANALMGALFVRDNAAVLQKAGIPANAGTLYMAHFMGAGGAVAFIKAMDQNPSASAAALFPAQARANESIFYAGGQSRSLSQVYDLMTTNPNKVSVAKAQAYDRMIGYAGGGVGSSPMLASGPKQPSYTRTSPVDVAKATQAPAQTHQQEVVATAGGGLAPMSAPMSVDSIPSTVSDEGMLILNTSGVQV